MTGSNAGDDEWQRTWHRLGETLGRKWSVHVLRLLAEGDAGFNEARRALDGITAKTLSARLTELRRRGFVERRVLPTSPPSTAYSLTPAGERFVALLRSMEEAVDVVPCEGCAEDCEVATVDPARTGEALREGC